MSEKEGEAQVFHEVKTLEQGKKYMMEIVGQVEKNRAQCDELTLRSLIGESIPTEVQAKLFKVLTVRYGQALGALTTLMHCRVLNEVAYNELRHRIDVAVLPKTLGSVRN